MNAASDWVENPFSCPDEDDVFEADSSTPTQIQNVIPADASEAVELDGADSEECYGDEIDADPVEHSVDPLDLFRLYGERSFPQARPLDFSDDVDLQSRALDSNLRRKKRETTLKASGELRRDLILRLRRQLHDLEQQDTAICGAVSDRLEKSTLPLENLRQCLTSLCDPECNGGNCAVVDSADTELASSRMSAGDLALEGRVARLEKNLAACDSPNLEGLWSLVESVRLQMQSADPSFWSEVRKSMDSATSKFETVAPLATGIDLCELLQRLKAVEVDACAIPVLIARLRTLKHSFDDASSAGTAIGELAQRCDALLSAKNENDALLAQLRANLDSNATTMRQNMESLDIRLNKVLSLTPDIG